MVLWTACDARTASGRQNKSEPEVRKTFPQRAHQLGGGKERTIRAADAKEVGVGNPAEETYRYPNQIQIE
jgi:hypothetical protein